MSGPSSAPSWLTRLMSPPRSPRLRQPLPSRRRVRRKVAEAPAEPLWQRIWRSSTVNIAILAAALAVLTGIFFFQHQLVKRPRLYDRVRLAFLIFTLLWLGWWVTAQLSVVNVLTFTNALMTGFSWDYFLLSPLVFILWSARRRGDAVLGARRVLRLAVPVRRVAGAYQPHRAHFLQDTADPIAVGPARAPVADQVRHFPGAVRPVALLAHTRRAGCRKWSHSRRRSCCASFANGRSSPSPSALVAANLFIERFFCRYLCPLGAALAIPARLRMFDWLRRYRECGNPCQRCANECPVQCIHPEGTSIVNECIYCMNCQMLYHHDQKCPVMIQKRLKRQKREALSSPAMRSGGREAEIADLPDGRLRAIPTRGADPLQSTKE